MKRRKWLVAALVSVLAGAFVVQASSTLKLAAEHNIAELARPALILMLEVGAVTGGAIYVLTRSAALRKRAGGLILVSAGLGLVGGVQAYGFLVAVPVTATLLGMIEVIAHFWREPDSTSVVEPESTVVEQDNQDNQPVVELPEPLVEHEAWRDQRPTEADYAAVLLDHLPRDGQRLTQEEMLEALRVVSPECSLYRVKKYRKQADRPRLEVAS